MEGLLIKLLNDDAGRPGYWFWRLFGPIRQDLDRLFWCFPNPPWMGAPEGYMESDSLVDAQLTCTQLWSPGSLGRYADHFGEENIELWGIEPTVDDPKLVAKQYDAAHWRKRGNVIREFGRVWLIYTDRTCWEMYAKKPRLLAETSEHLRGKQGISVYPSHSDQRGEAFGRAELSRVWRNLK